MKPLFPRGLVLGTSLLFTQILPLPAQEPRGSALRLVDPAFQEHFNSDVSRSPRFRVDRPVWRRKAFSRPIVEVLPAPLQETQVEEVVASPDPTATPVVTPVVTPNPTLNPAPSVTPVPTPLTPDPTPPEVKRPPLLPVPSPNPAPVIPPRPVPAPAPFLSGRPDLEQFERARPQVEVWRGDSPAPQRPKREGPGRYRVWTVRTEPVTIVLKFHPLLVGRTIRLMSAGGVRLSDAALTIGPTGEATVSVQLEANRRVGEIAFNLDSIKTVLRLQRAPLEAVTRIENQSAEETP